MKNPFRENKVPKWIAIILLIFLIFIGFSIGLTFLVSLIRLIAIFTIDPVGGIVESAIYFVIVWFCYKGIVYLWKYIKGK